MGVIRDEPPTAKLFFALLSNSADTLLAARRRLDLDFSAVEIESLLSSEESLHEVCGPAPLQRHWIVTSLPVYLHELPDVRRYASRLEESFSTNGCTVSIDPGYVTPSKVVRITTRDEDHRIFLARGIFAEPVLRLGEGNAVEPWPWSPPDYRSAEAAGFFLQVRACLPAELTNPVEV